MQTFKMDSWMSLTHTYTLVNTTTFPLPQNVLSQSQLSLGLDNCSVFYHCRLDLLFLEFHINGVL